MLILLDNNLLIAQIAEKAQIGEEVAKIIVQDVLRDQRAVHDGEMCKNDTYAQDVCTGTYQEKVDEVLGLLEALRAIYALTGENNEVRALYENIMRDFDYLE